MSNGVCALHEFDGAGCGTCAEDAICGISGNCEPRQQPQLDLTVLTTLDGAETSLVAQSDGLVYGQLSTTSADPAVDLVVSWSGGGLSLDGLSLPRADIAASVEIEGDYWAPGALTAAWTDGAQGAYPLAVVTGLEFQGLVYEHAFAAWGAAGCVQIVAGTRLYSF